MYTQPKRASEVVTHEKQALHVPSLEESVLEACNHYRIDAEIVAALQAIPSDATVITKSGNTVDDGDAIRHSILRNNSIFEVKVHEHGQNRTIMHITLPNPEYTPPMYSEADLDHALLIAKRLGSGERIKPEHAIYAWPPNVHLGISLVSYQRVLSTSTEQQKSAWATYRTVATTTAPKPEELPKVILQLRDIMSDIGLLDRLKDDPIEDKYCEVDFHRTSGTVEVPTGYAALFRFGGNSDPFLLVDKILSGLSNEQDFRDLKGVRVDYSPPPMAKVIVSRAMEVVPTPH